VGNVSQSMGVATVVRFIDIAEKQITAILKKIGIK
jgi:hypothetical protein